MHYTAEISRVNPSCFLFLIDQSGSMSDPFGGGGGKRKADGVSDTINRLLFNYHISSQAGSPILFPDGESGLPDEHSRLLFGMSSVLPAGLIEAARGGGKALGDVARYQQAGRDRGARHRAPPGRSDAQ